MLFVINVQPERWITAEPAEIPRAIQSLIFLPTMYSARKPVE